MAFNSLCSSLTVDSKTYKFYNLTALNDPRYDTLPLSIRYLLESAVRNCDEFHVLRKNVDAILDWQNTQYQSTEIPFIPARVLLQDFTGVPAVVDLASMRAAVHCLGCDPGCINPICPVDLVIDHSVQVDRYGSLDALAKNQEIEFRRNLERFSFLKWGAKAFKNLSIIPPGSGIVHQVNLEYLSRGVFCTEDGLLYPDSVVGTDSHTTMNNGSGVLAWGVGGIEAEAVMLGQSITMVVPEVIGYKLIGSLPSNATATDLVLAITKELRSFGVVGKFVEFFGPGVATLDIADRATIANMCPEYGATIGFFPVDNRTIRYLRLTGRDEHSLRRMESYLKAIHLFVNYEDEFSKISYSKVYELDLSSIVPCVSGPKRPHDVIPLRKLSTDFTEGLTARVSFKGFGIKEEDKSKCVIVKIDGKNVELKHGSIVISAITSCTNTSNPSVMLGAGLVAKKAVEAGLRVPQYVKTSLSPGSGVVTAYLEKSGLLPYLQKLGYHIVGYGCMTCIGNSGALHPEVTRAIEENGLVVAGVLSGNRNFEGRIHSHVRANYLASPPLVVVYGLAGRIDIDLENEPIGVNDDGKKIYFHDIWPSREEISTFQSSCVIPKFFADIYSNIHLGSDMWQKLHSIDSQLYPWDDQSTYIRKAPFFENMTKEPSHLLPIRNAHALLNVGDSVTTDHISPAGSISMSSPAARYLLSKGVEQKDFNTYGARRGNDEVMTRGTFANIRLMNKLIGKTGPRTVFIPSGEEMSVFDAAEMYKKNGLNVIILAGKDYGCGSSRDWAAKGPSLLGVKAVIAESYERIHRSNLVGMGIMPLQYKTGENAQTLNLSGREVFSIEIPEVVHPHDEVQIKLGDGRSFSVINRLDTKLEVSYYYHGGVLPYMVRKLISD